MKKMIIALAILVSMTGAVNAQVQGTTLGIRFANAFNGGELTLQLPLGAKNRLELDLGLTNWRGSDDGFQLTGVYQWVFGLNEIATGLNVYAGLGGSLGTYNYSDDNSNLGLGFVGQLGVEYNFNIPLQVSFDWRPTIFNTYYTYYGGNGISLRYRF